MPLKIGSEASKLVSTKTLLQKHDDCGQGIIHFRGVDDENIGPLQPSTTSKSESDRS